VSKGLGLGLGRGLGTSGLVNITGHWNIIE